MSPRFLARTGVTMAATLLTTSVVASAPAQAAPATRISYFSPITAAGTLAPGFTLENASAHCDAASPSPFGGAGTYRCVNGALLKVVACWKDPASASHVVCAGSPWHKTLWRYPATFVTAPAPKAKVAGWLEASNGGFYGNVLGESESMAAGYPTDYVSWLPNDQAIAHQRNLGQLNTATAPWTALVGESVGGDPTAHRVTILRAWYLTARAGRGVPAHTGVESPFPARWRWAQQWV